MYVLCTTFVVNKRIHNNQPAILHL